MSKKEFECRWSKKTCVFHKESEKKPGNLECLMCFANAFRTYGQHLADILASVGVGRSSRSFLEDYLEFRLIESDYFKAVATIFPWIKEEADKRMSKAMSKAIVIAPRGLPKGFMKELEKRVETGEAPRELLEMLRKFEKRGDKAVV